MVGDGAGQNSENKNIVVEVDSIGRVAVNEDDGGVLGSKNSRGRLSSHYHATALV